MRLLDVVNQLWWRTRLPQCYACRTPMSERVLLCPLCAEEYRESLAWECGLCGRRPSECLCVTEDLARARVHRMIKLFRYRVEAPSAASAMVYFMKRRNSRILHDFFAVGLAEAISRQLDGYEGFTLTFAPRSRQMLARYGFDQSELLAKAIGRALSLPVRRLLRRRRFSKPQKKVKGYRERRQNVAEAFYVPPCKEIPRRVLLVDDISTTGATLAECVRELRRAGVREVVPVVIAFVAHNPNQKYEERNRVP